MVGRELWEIFPPKRAAPRTPALLEVEGLSSPGAFSERLLLAAGRARSSGLAGLVGAGRTEVAEAVMGLRPRHGHGRASAGRTRRPRERRARRCAAGIGYLSEDRQGSGVGDRLRHRREHHPGLAARLLRGCRGLVDRARGAGAGAERWRELFAHQGRRPRRRRSRSSPAATSRRSPWPRASTPSPRCSSWTSPPAASTWAPSRRSTASSPSWRPRASPSSSSPPSSRRSSACADRVLVMREGRVAGVLEGAAVERGGDHVPRHRHQGRSLGA